MTGLLYVVSTPIGNLADLSERAREVLSSVERVACEDTRRTGRLMHHLGISKPLVSLHDHNERQRTPSLIEALSSGESLALVSDAGTPLLSDPGFLLVREAIAAGVRVEAIPGAAASLTALVVSGLPAYPHTFVGFPPPRKGKRRTFFERYEDLGHTLVLYESPHRLIDSLEDALEVMGDRLVSISRELTKMHEETVRGRLSEVTAELRSRSSLKGEFVVVIAAR